MRPAFRSIIETRLSPEKAGRVANVVLDRLITRYPPGNISGAALIAKKSAQSYRIGKEFQLRGLKTRYLNAATGARRTSA